MKITLINPPITVEQIYGKYSGLASFQPPIGLCSLAGYLIKNGHEVNITDANVLNLSTPDILKTIATAAPHLIGIYMNTSNYYAASRLVSSIKNAGKPRRIVCGGPHPTFLPEDTLRETAADYCVIGEGEETLSELATALENNAADLSSIRGLAFKTDDKGITINEPRERITDLDKLPFPAVHLLPDLSRYKLYLLQYKRLPYMTVMTSRGCPHRCVFCNTPFGKIVRFHSPEYVADYIGHLSKQSGIREIFFVDDTFTIDEERVLRICDLIRKRGLDVTWNACVRANIKNKDIFHKMKEAGCWTCALGVESGDAGILRLIKKDISLDDVRSSCDTILKADLVLKTFFILGNPGETLETIEKTIRFARSLRSHYPVFSLMTPFPGAELWKTAEEYGKFDRTDFRKLLLAGSDPVFIPYGLTKEILLEKQREAFRRLYLAPDMILRQLALIRSPEDVRKIARAFLAFIRIQLN